MPHVTVERVLTGPTQRRAAGPSRISIEGDRISGVAKCETSNGLLAMPALANAHDHARAVKPVALGALELPLELWLAAITGAPSVDPYIIAAVAFARSALGGAGAIMAHLVRLQGGMSVLEEAKAVARAAEDVGVRIAFALSMRDRNSIAYGDDERTLELLPAASRKVIKERLAPPYASPEAQVALVDEIAAQISSPLVTVQYGPAAVQWCSEPLLKAIAERSAATGRRVHMHLLETRYQREWADRHYPQGIVKFLDDIGLLSPRLSLAHAVWARPEELELLAKRGAIISVNNSSNLGLASGVPPVREMLRAKVPIAIGLDGVGLDDDDDALRELRLAWYLHQGTGFDQALDACTLLRAASETGRRAVTGIDEPAAIEAGRLADMLVLDRGAFSRDVISETLEDLPLILARATSRHIVNLYVAGREIVSHGRILGVDLPALEEEMLAQLKRGMAGFNEWQRTVLQMRAGLTRFYATGMHCA
ncbi:MAG TPA: amidohydrolase family protein [Burkholderiales bacterium]|nr:amidohydrolase family protein [Burkholderiales bacterium]